MSKFIATTVFLCFLAFPVFAEDTYISSSLPYDKLGFMVEANIQAARFGISAEKLKDVLKKESGYSPTAIGDDGAARGIAQYHHQTWVNFSQKYTQEASEVLTEGNPHDDIKLTAWAFSKGYGRSWSTY